MKIRLILLVVAAAFIGQPLLLAEETVPVEGQDSVSGEQEIVTEADGKALEEAEQETELKEVGNKICPLSGHKVGEMMNKANEFLYDFTSSTMELTENQTILEIGFGNGNFFDKLFSKANNLKALYNNVLIHNIQ